MDERTTEELERARQLVDGQLRRIGDDASEAAAGSGSSGGDPGAGDALEGTGRDSRVAPPEDQTACGVANGIEAVVIGYESAGYIRDDGELQWHPGGVEYLFRSTAHPEAELDWWLDGVPMGTGSSVTFIIPWPGRHTVAYEREGSGGDGRERTVCVEPATSIEEIEGTGTKPLEYLAENGDPAATAVGNVRWFTVGSEAVGEDGSYEWTLEPLQGQGSGAATVFAPSSLTTPVELQRAGEYELVLTVTTEDGVSAEHRRVIEVELDPEVYVEAIGTSSCREAAEVEGDRELPDGTATVSATAEVGLLSTAGLSFRWYLNEQDEPITGATGASVTFEADPMVYGVRVEIEHEASGDVTTAATPLLGGTESRYANGANIAVDAACVPVNEEAEQSGGTPLQDPSGHFTGDVVVFEEPQVVRFTTGEAELPSRLRPSYNWSVLYSERFRNGLANPDDYHDEDASDLASEYGQLDQGYELEGRTALHYPFTEPGWYVVELELWDAATDETRIPEHDPETGATRFDVMLVYVMGLEDPTAAWPDPEDVEPQLSE